MKIMRIIYRLLLMQKISVSKTPLSFFSNLLMSQTPFSFARFGDGEWAGIVGQQGANCDGHEYSQGLKEGLRNCLNNPLGYHYAIQPRAIKNDAKEILAYLKKHPIEIKWHNADVFHDANLSAQLYPLVESLRKREVVLVGPKHLKSLDQNVFPLHSFLEIPANNCFESIDSIKKNILSTAETSEHLVFALSASMAANVIIHDLFPQIGEQHTMLDLGSLWDVYVGVQSRSVYRNRDWDSIIAANLNG